jgi:hypothetical protein
MAGLPGEGGDYSKKTPKHNSIETQRALLKVISKIKVKDAGKDATTTKEIQDLHEAEYMKTTMRRCISFKDLREYKDDNDEFQKMVDEIEEDGEWDKQYNFISEPSSPT